MITIYCTLHRLRGSGSDPVGAHAMRRPEAKGWRLAVAWAVAVFCCSVSRPADALPYSGLSASEDNALFVYFEDPGDKPSVGQLVVLSDFATILWRVKAVAHDSSVQLVAPARHELGGDYESEAAGARGPCAAASTNGRHACVSHARKRRR